MKRLCGCDVRRFRALCCASAFRCWYLTNLLRVLEPHWTRTDLCTWWLSGSTDNRSQFAYHSFCSCGVFNNGGGVPQDPAARSVLAQSEAQEASVERSTEGSFASHTKTDIERVHIAYFLSDGVCWAFYDLSSVRITTSGCIKFSLSEREVLWPRQVANPENRRRSFHHRW